MCIAEKQVFSGGDSDEEFADQKRSEALRNWLEAYGIEATVLLPPSVRWDWPDVPNEFGV